MSTYTMKDIPTVSKYVLTHSNNTFIHDMNEGMFDTKAVGIFEVVGYNTTEDKVMIRKPIEEGKSFVITFEEYARTFKDLIPIILHNN